MKESPLEEYYKNPEQYVPHGMYCCNVAVCIFWDVDETKPEQENGYCHFIKQGDWEIDGLLWDQCKECGINMDWEDERLLMHNS